MSFNPFLGGKRVCLGKTFADLSGKIVFAAILSLFDYEFVNPEHAVEKPSYNMSNSKDPEVFLKIKLASPYQ
jgi:cytochrome P450